MTHLRKLMNYVVGENRIDPRTKEQFKDITITLNLENCLSVQTQQGKEALKKMLMERFEAMLNGLLY